MQITVVCTVESDNYSNEPFADFTGGLTFKDQNELHFIL